MTTPLATLSLLHGSAEAGRDAAFLVLLGFLLSFLFIRTSTRMIRAEVSWWPGNVETESGLHLHHLVWGIAFMLIGGFAAFALKTPAQLSGGRWHRPIPGPRRWFRQPRLISD